MTTESNPADAVREAPMTDTFNGDNAHLIECIAALLSLDSSGALVPHGIGGHARVLLASAACRLAALAGAGPAAWLYRFPFNETEGTDYCISPTRFLPSWVESRGATETPLFPHAPAKAREDDARRVLEWLASEDTGMSSEAIAYHMLGMYSEGSHPHDPADLGRCLRLLELFPAWKPRIREMAAYSRNWAALSARWEELAVIMDDEVGIDWSKGRNAPRTYEAMKSAMRAALATFSEGAE